MVELPNCPICLERLDGNVSGLITVSCGHDFHCRCLLKWGDSRYVWSLPSSYSELTNGQLSSLSFNFIA